MKILLRTIPGMRFVLLFTATTLGFTALSSGRQPRDWRDGKISMVQRPDDRDVPPSNPVGMATGRIPVLESTGRGEVWVYVIELGDKSYVAGYTSPGRKSYLGTLTPGRPIKASIEKRNIYLLDPKGKEWKLRLLEK